MKIYSMTATFGKLEHETLTLKPGLNIIEAPNEWGKSTWCAFLVNMLYGLDTKARTTKSELADKERYTPWSGAPMSGRIDLNWNGRNITIERQTRGRLLFGEFSAYETDSGLPVPELNGTNCGQMLLGVERSVFTRAGFLKLADLPVTQDDALRRRLNNLVTTGDENGAGDKLQQTLRDLKNKCRYNRTGLLPQAENQRQQLEGQLGELEDLQQQTVKLKERQAELEDRAVILENHRAALRYNASLADAKKVSQAEAVRDELAGILRQKQTRCEPLPSREEAQHALLTGKELLEQQRSQQMEAQLLPPLPQQPEIPQHYTDIAPDQAVEMAKADFDAQAKLEKRRKKQNGWLWAYVILALLAIGGGAACYFLLQITQLLLYIAIGGGIVVLGILAMILCGIRNARFRKNIRAIYDRHPGLAVDRWIADAENFAQVQRSYADALAQAQAIRGDLDSRQTALAEQIRSFSGENALEDSILASQQTIAAWDELADAQRDLQRAQSHVVDLKSMAKIAEPPHFPDTLTYTETETDGYISSVAFELKQLQLRLGQYQGRAEALGQEALIRTQLKAVSRRISQLEDFYAAMEIAQNALSTATTELQRRFAPRIAKRAQALFTKLTAQRYERLTLSEDLSLNTCTKEENALRPAQWRSDGTVDQLYLALRLAVAEELTPNAPLVLDDAFVRFDDARLAVAMDILRETAQNKQVILFTCQGRETTM